MKADARVVLYDHEQSRNGTRPHCRYRWYRIGSTETGVDIDRLVLTLEEGLGVVGPPSIPCAGATGPLISVDNTWRQVELGYQRQRAIWCFYGYDSA
jgi:hypothetical protein